MKLKYFIFVFLILMLVGSVSALNELGTFKQNECVEIKQTCSSCSYVNASISYPNSTRALTNIQMSEISPGVWTYDFCNTSNLGRYDVIGEGDLSGTPTSFATYFTITTSGAIAINSGEGISLFGSVFVILSIGVLFFVLSMRVNQPITKFILLVFSIIIFIIIIFYSMVIVQQTIGNFESIVEGYTTFFTVLKILIGLFFLIFLVLGLLVAIKYYKFKRGFID